MTNDNDYLSLKQWLEETKDVPLEAMDAFFNVRIGDYEDHMSQWTEHYRWMAELIPEGTTVSWGGSATNQQIGLINAVKNGNYDAVDRFAGATAEERDESMRRSMFAEVFLTSANAISMDGQMVNVDGFGNRVAAIICGPKKVIVVAGMNKVEDTLEAAITRARTVAAPMNKQRFDTQTPCMVTGVCGDCKAEACICNHIVVTRHSRPVGRITFILVGEPLGF